MAKESHLIPPIINTMEYYLYDTDIGVAKNLTAKILVKITGLPNKKYYFEEKSMLHNELVALASSTLDKIK